MKKTTFRSKEEVRKLLSLSHEELRKILGPSQSKVLTLEEQEKLGLLSDDILTISTRPSGSRRVEK